MRLPAGTGEGSSGGLRETESRSDDRCPEFAGAFDRISPRTAGAGTVQAAHRYAVPPPGRDRNGEDSQTAHDDLRNYSAVQIHTRRSRFVSSRRMRMLRAYPKHVRTDGRPVRRGQGPHRSGRIPSAACGSESGDTKREGIAMNI